MAKFRCNEVVTDISTLRLRQSFVNEGRLPELESLGIDAPGRVLGRVSGIGFMGDFASGNGRWYPSELWEKTCAADYIKEQLETHLMFGEVGHPADGDKDADAGVVDWKLGANRYSHVITKLDYSNAPTGVIEFLIMDNPGAGAALYGAYCAGAKLSVSSRAMADYLPGETYNGMPIMDPDSYWLDTFDIVRVPGIAIATPDRVELLADVKKKIESARKRPSKTLISVPELDFTVKEALNDKPFKVKKADYSSILF